jgi:hypothetical protein
MINTSLQDLLTHERGMLDGAVIGRERWAAMIKVCKVAVCHPKQSVRNHALRHLELDEDMARYFVENPEYEEAVVPANQR